MSSNALTLTDTTLGRLSDELVNIKVDGIEIAVPKGINAIEAAKMAGVDIPYFCYHPRLSKGDAANCRMCLIEAAAPRKNPDGSVVVAKFPKPQAACTLPVTEGTRSTVPSATAVVNAPFRIT